MRRSSAAEIFLQSPLHYNLIQSLKDAASEHCHEFFEFFYVLEGEMMHCVNGKNYSVGKNSLHFLRPNDVHSFLRKGDFDCAFLNIAVSVGLFSEICQFLGNDYRMELFLSPLTYPSAETDSEAHQRITTCWQRVCMLPPDATEREIEGKLLLAGLLTSFFSPKRPASAMPPWFSALLKETANPEYFSDGVSGMAKRCGKSAAHISRSFQRYLGVTPTDWLLEIRMRYAANLLASSDMSILEISITCGFLSLSHMYHCFSGAYHMTPKEYRHRYGKELLF